MKPTRVWHFFDLSTGQIKPRTYAALDDSCLALNMRENEGTVEGVLDHLSQRVDPETLAIEDWQPPAPDADHEWVHDDEHGNRVRRWMLKSEVVERRARKATALTRIAELERKEPRATREHLLDIVPSEADRAAGAMTLQEIEEEIAAQRAIINATESNAT